MSQVKLKEVSSNLEPELQDDAVRLLEAIMATCPQLPKYLEASAANKPNPAEGLTTTTYDTLATAIYVEGQPPAVASRALELATKVTGKPVTYLELLTSPEIKQRLLEHCQTITSSDAQSSKNILEVLAFLKALLVQDQSLEPHRKDFVDACEIKPNQFPDLSTNFNVLDLFKIMHWANEFMIYSKSLAGKGFEHCLAWELTKPNGRDLSLAEAPQLHEGHQKRLLIELVRYIFFKIFEKICQKPRNYQDLWLVADAISDFNYLLASIQDQNYWQDLRELAIAKQREVIEQMITKLNSDGGLLAIFQARKLISKFNVFGKFSYPQNEALLADAMAKIVSRELDRIDKYPEDKRPEAICDLLNWGKSIFDENQNQELEERCLILLREWLNNPSSEEMDLKRLKALQKPNTFPKVTKLFRDCAQPKLTQLLEEIKALDDTDYLDKSRRLAKLCSNYSELLTNALAVMSKEIFETIVEVVRLTHVGNQTGALAELLDAVKVENVYFLTTIVRRAMTCPVKTASDPEIKLY